MSSTRDLLDTGARPYSTVPVRIGRGAYKRMQSTINQLTFNNLLRHALSGDVDIDRVTGGTDRDYIELVSQLRRYFYGSMNDATIKRLLNVDAPPKTRLSGQVALFPATSPDDWKKLDRYMRTTVYRAIRKRANLIAHLADLPDAPKIWTLGYFDFDRTPVFSANGNRVSLCLPSTKSMNNLVSKMLKSHGPRVLEASERVY